MPPKIVTPEVRSLDKRLTVYICVKMSNTEMEPVIAFDWTLVIVINLCILSESHAF